MDYEKMLQQHVDSGADVTVGCLEAPLEEARAFGVMHIDTKDNIIAFLEKPKNPPHMPGKPDVALCSMGIYVFETSFLIDILKRDAADQNSSHDFGKDIIPYIVKNGKAVAHHFSQSCVISTEEAKHYWRDVGTVDAYWGANIDLTDIVPDLDLYDRAWPIWTYGEITPPAKFVHDIDGRRGLAISSLLSGGCIVSGAAISRSLVSTGVRGAFLFDRLPGGILPYAHIGQHEQERTRFRFEGEHVYACARRRRRAARQTLSPDDRFRFGACVSDGAGWAGPVRNAMGRTCPSNSPTLSSCCLAPHRSGKISI
jgi:glucose-1-phosphate adenylyltransferase